LVCGGDCRIARQLSRCQLRRLCRSWQLTARFERKSIKFEGLGFDVSGFAFGGVPCLQENPSIVALLIELVNKTGLIEIFDDARIHE